MINALSGRSSADSGCANISGVPAFGLPNTISVAGGMAKPTALASACWSQVAKTLMPCSDSAASSRCTVS